MNYLFTMADMEESATAEFGRGPDRGKRKKRGAGFYAAAGGAGLAGAGAIGAGVRYGGAYLAGRRENKALADMFKRKPGDPGLMTQNAAGMLGARTKAGRDLEYTKRNLSAAGRSVRGTVSKGMSKLPTGLRKALKGKTLGGKIGYGVAGAGALGGAVYGGYKMYQGRKKKK